MKKRPKSNHEQAVDLFEAGIRRAVDDARKLAPVSSMDEESDLRALDEAIDLYHDVVRCRLRELDDDEDD